VGLEKSDDAGVYRLTPELAVIQTVDFFTPIVDDPRDFGRIAATNAFSDVYAMGGRPITAMNIACFPVKTLPMEVLREVLAGGLDTIRAADAVLIGGHSVDDPELKYGLCVTGTIHPDEVRANTDAKAGDRLVLTTPSGTGIIATAVKREAASPEAAEEVARSMMTLNRTAAEVMQRVGVNACTDVTGFGLMGHALEMAEGSNLALEIEARAVPLFSQTLAYAEQKMVPGGSTENRKYFGGKVTWAGDKDELLDLVLFDAQTSGGLLIAVPEDRADRLVQNLRDEGVAAVAVIGSCKPGTPGIELR